MLYYLLYQVLARIDGLSFLRVFRYPSMRILAAAITALILSFLIGPWFIERLRSRQIGQQIRLLRPGNHKGPIMLGALDVIPFDGRRQLTQAQPKGRDLLSKGFAE